MLEADTFAMSRAADGAGFAWTSYGYGGEVADVASVSFSDANYFLPDTTTVRALGYDSIAPLERYELEVVVGGDTIRGSTVKPDTFSVQIIERQGRGVAVCPRVEGAAGYRVGLQEAESVLLTNTVYALPENALGSGRDLIVQALDPNTWPYFSDGQTASAGVRGRWGLFGAMTSVTVQL